MRQAGGNLHYELKSVQNVPPQDFSKQFINDLSAIDNLNQLKWVFDKKKIGSLNKQVFLDKLAQADNIDQEVLDKFGDGTLEGLLINIDNNFTSIFVVK